jgi:hypothetical protein
MPRAARPRRTPPPSSSGADSRRAFCGARAAPVRRARRHARIGRPRDAASCSERGTFPPSIRGRRSPEDVEAANLRRRRCFSGSSVPSDGIVRRKPTGKEPPFEALKGPVGESESGSLLHRPTLHRVSRLIRPERSSQPAIATAPIAAPDRDCLRPPAPAPARALGRRARSLSWPQREGSSSICLRGHSRAGLADLNQAPDRYPRHGRASSRLEPSPPSRGRRPVADASGRRVADVGCYFTPPPPPVSDRW